ncbi:MAG: hypothetical protein H7070_08740 [Saprospiraceae bacterium]|nr:hypothetical protein [Pyrinomonadaceae bacterium]
MKNTMKVFLVVALFCSTAFADGDMGSGGFAEGDMGSGGKTVTTGEPCIPGDMGSGGKTCTGNRSIFESVQEFIAELFG